MHQRETYCKKKKKVNLIMGTKFEQLLGLISYFIFFLLIFFKLFLKLKTCIQFLDGEDPLGKGVATHSRILAWRIPWTEESGGLQSIRLQRVGYN